MEESNIQRDLTLIRKEKKKSSSSSSKEYIIMEDNDGEAYIVRKIRRKFKKKLKLSWSDLKDCWKKKREESKEKL